MSKEFCDIISAYEKAKLNGRQTALATVVHVEGSSYRRPGARMLIEDNGKLTGAISGGCLEGDTLRKALLAMAQKQNKLVTYNSLDDDDVAFGVQLGCNGIVHILIEPIDPSTINNPIFLLKQCVLQRKDAVLVTMFSLQNYFGQQWGTCLFYDGEKDANNLGDQIKIPQLIEDARTVISAKSSILKHYGENELAAFVEFIQPPISLILVGAGNDAMPMVKMAVVLGWQVTIIDGRSTHANRQHFPKADQIIVGKPAEAIKQITIDERTAFVLMTHNYNYDLSMLQLILQKKCSYIGTLGPKKRLQRMLDALEQSRFKVTSKEASKIYGPTGLDIGAESPEEIALSVLAEIKAVLAKREGTSLRNRLNSIHENQVNMERKKNEKVKVH